MHSVRKLAILAALGAIAGAGAAEAGTLDDVKKKGFVQCGVSQGNPGFSSADARGNWTGFDVDLCRAISAAVFGNPDKVKYTALSAKERFTALQSGEVDVLSRTTTWTLVRDTALGLNFAGVNYYDGQGFMVPKKLNVKNAKQLNGASVCVAIGTTTELNLADYFRANSMTYKPVVFEKADEVRGAYDAGRCDVFTTDRSSLATQRTLLKSPEDHVVLPEIISKEPLGPVVRHGDDQWLDLVKWVLYAMLEAEEYGVTSENLDAMKANSKDPVVKRLLGLEGDMGKSLGVSNEWAYNIVKSVGNYSESYERHLGPKTPIKLDRGANALWNQGGLQYPMPVR